MARRKTGIESCPEVVGIPLMARACGKTESEVKTLCRRGLPHRFEGKHTYRIPVKQAVEWVASSPFASNRMLTLDSAAKHARVTRGVVKRWMDRGLMPVHRTPDGRKWLSVDELSRFLRDELPKITAQQPAHSRGNWKPGRTNADPTAHAWLYEIIDPKDKQAIYVGYTTNYKVRRSDHLSALKAGRHTNRQLQNVYNKRLAQGKRLQVRPIRDGMSQLIIEAEVRAIADLRKKIGSRLCNATRGGEGATGLTQEVRDRIAANSRAKWQDAEYRKRWEASRSRSKKAKTKDHWGWLNNTLKGVSNAIAKKLDEADRYGGNAYLLASPERQAEMRSKKRGEIQRKVQTQRWADWRKKLAIAEAVLATQSQ